MLRHRNISALFVQKAPQDISLTPSADVSAAGPVDQEHVLERCAPVVDRMKQQTADRVSPKLDEKALFVTTRSFLQFAATLTIRQFRCFAVWSPCKALYPSFSRLKQLEQEVVGGEQVRNEELQQRHSQRKKLADQRKEHLIRALTGDGEESENVLLDVYNSIQEEVYAKSQMLLKVQGKVGGLFWRGSRSL